MADDTRQSGKEGSPPEADERELVRRAAQGDRIAFEALFRRKRPRIYRLAARICGPTEADDIVQVVFLRLWRELPVMDLRNIDAWLTRVAINRSIDMLRHVGRRVHMMVNERNAGVAHAVVEPFVRGEMAQVFNHAALRLGERQRVAFILTEMEGFTSEEAGQLMEISASTVRNLTAQARGNLRQALREFFPEYAPARETKEQEDDRS